MKLFVMLVLTCVLIVACSSLSKHEGHGPITLPPPVSIQTFDIARGASLAQQGNANGAAACLGCHGANGEGVPAGGFPRLAGQSRYYLAKQLEAYRDRTRINPVMEPIAKALSAQEISDVTAYYESMTNVAYAKTSRAHASAVKRAFQLANLGDQKKGLQSCQNCHGPGGIGEPPAIPFLKGQSALYISAQLQAWKTGTRKTNPEQMGYIAKLLNDADIASVAAFYQDVPAGETK